MISTCCVSEALGKALVGHWAHSVCVEAGALGQGLVCQMLFVGNKGARLRFVDALTCVFALGGATILSSEW